MRRLVGQALINIVKNAIEAIEGRIAESGAEPAGSDLACRSRQERARSPSPSKTTARACRKQGRERLTEPYVTTRTKGTGLGLAIVKKIMEDHQGELVLEDREAGRRAGASWYSPREARGCGARPIRRRRRRS